MFRLLTTGIYDFYRDHAPGNAYGTDATDKRYALYDELSRETLSIERGVFSIVMTAAVYASGIAFLISAVALAVASFGKAEKLAQAKKKLMLVVLISILIFSVSLGVNMIQNMGLDSYKCQHKNVHL